MSPAWLLSFMICAASLGGHDDCEHGTVVARSCEAAVAWMQAGLRDGQTLHLGNCERYVGQDRGNGD